MQVIAAVAGQLADTMLIQYISVGMLTSPRLGCPKVDQQALVRP